MNLRQRHILATGLRRGTDRAAVDTYPTAATWTVAIAVCVAFLSLCAALDARDAALEAPECAEQQR